MVKENIYDFSFTAASLREKELRFVAESIRNDEKANLNVTLGNGKEATGKRLFVEYQKRLGVLTSEQVTILIEGSLTSQKQVAFLAMAKLHGFICDFTIEILREKVLLFDYKLTEGEYVSFFRRKLEEYPSMYKMSDLTHKKIRQVLFKVLEQAGIIDSIKNKEIQPQLLDDKLISAITNDNKKWLRLFFVSDMDIENYKY